MMKGFNGLEWENLENNRIGCDFQNCAILIGMNGSGAMWRIVSGGFETRTGQCHLPKHAKRRAVRAVKELNRELRMRRRVSKKAA